MNRKKLFNFCNSVLLKGSTFHLNDKIISDIGALNFGFRHVSEETAGIIKVSDPTFYFLKSVVF